MSIIAMFHGSYCHEKEIIDDLVKKLNYKHITDNDILNEASERFRVPVKKLARAMFFSPSIFNKFTHEKERSIAYIRMVLAERMKNDNILHTGFAGHLLPKNISHVLKVCIIADIDYRAELASKREGISVKDAFNKIKKKDDELNRWTQYLYGMKPWDAKLFDIVIPIDKRSKEESKEAAIEEAVHIVYYNLQRDIIKRTAKSINAMNDFVLASGVNIALAEKGHDVLVSCRNREITIVIDKYVMRLDALEKELNNIASAIPGVRNVKTRVGPNFNKPDIYRKFEFEKSSRVLLVDDEKDFAHTLSERLQLKDVGSAAVYNGEEALSILESEEPDVMVLDLKMPGIEGMEVLRRVRKEHPHVKIIILTGHGSEEDKIRALELGAVAYLQKPVNIEILMQTVRDAHKEKMKSEQPEE